MEVPSMPRVASELLDTSVVLVAGSTIEVAASNMVPKVKAVYMRKDNIKSLGWILTSESGRGTDRD
jgi:hypothetical protein